MQDTIKHTNKNRHRFSSHEYMAFSFFSTIRVMFDDIRLIFSGEKIETKNSEIKKMISEVYNIDIPLNSVDRANLKSDVKAISEDLKKALDEKVAEAQD